MKTFFKSPWHWLAVVAVAQGPLVADPIVVTSFDVFKLQSYEQTSSAQPVSASNYYFNARIFLSSPISNPATAHFTSPADPLGHDLANGGGILQYPVGFGNLADLDTAFGAGNYNFSLQASELGVTTQTGTLHMPANAYATTVPYFTNFTSLQNLNASQDAVFNWNGFSTNSSAAESDIFLFISNTTQNINVANVFFSGASTTSYTLGSSALVAGDSYSAALYFSSRNPAPGAWNGGAADGLVAFDQVTVMSFTAIPEPAATALVVGGFFGLVFVGRLACRRRSD